MIGGSVLLIISWCLASDPSDCIKDRTGYRFDSGIACILAAAEIEGQEADLHPGRVPHVECGPPKEET